MFRIPLRCILSAIPLLLVATPPSATTWNVPADFALVGDAVGAAAAGDTVRIACGTYAEHDIALTREITMLGETGAPDCVVIDAQGAGRVFLSDDPAGEAHLEGITVTGGAVSGPDPWTGWGGGMLFIGASPTLVRCAFESNSATGGGGLALSGHGTPTLVDCTVTGNAAEQGGGVLCWVTTAELTDCTLAGNSADSLGGGVAATLATVTIRGATFHANAAQVGGALYGDVETSIDVENTVIVFGSLGEAAWCDSTSTATLACCDVSGNVGGDWVSALAGQAGVNGNFTANPLFCDAASGDFTLQSASPCLPGQHPDGAACGLIGAHGAGSCGSVSDAPDAAWAAATRLRVTPNPFHEFTVIRSGETALPGSRLSIFDVQGRRIRSLDPASGSVVWDGRDGSGRPLPAGVYFVRWESSGRVRTVRALRLR